MKCQGSNDGVKMSGQCEGRPSIWDFARAFYAKDGVEVDCLTAQNHFGLDVTALIFALHRSHLGQGFPASLAAGRARAMSEAVIIPLRTARLALKSLQTHVAQDDVNALRQRVKAVELDAERLTLEALATLPKSEHPRDAYSALCAVSHHAHTPISLALDALLKRLALQCENM